MSGRKGKVIHKCRDDDGVMEIIDDQLTRSLYFGTYAKQSSMLLNKPESIVLAYTQAMMSCLLFKENPGNALIIGLGGGSLVKFLFHHYPECKIDVVESRQAVIRIAHDYFRLPEDERINILTGDGAEYIARQHPIYDIILIDAFDHLGMSDSVVSKEFFRLCRLGLASDGVMSINLWSGSRHGSKRIMRDLQSGFFDNTLRLPVKDKGNVIMLAFRHHINGNWFEKLRGRANILRSRLGLDYPAYLKQLYRHNTSFIKRLVS